VLRGEVVKSAVCEGNWGRRRHIAILFTELAFNWTDDE
jgi:hypothetical protein